MAEPTVDERVARGKREILADVASGRVPPSVASFSELHDHVDANEYAGLTEDWPDSDRDPAGMDRRADVGNAVQDALDAWIRGGGVATHEDPPEQPCPGCGRDMAAGELHTAECEVALEQDRADGSL